MDGQGAVPADLTAVRRARPTPDARCGCGICQNVRVSQEKSAGASTVEHRPVTIVHRPALDRALGEEWDRKVTDQPGSDVTQLLAWGRVRRAAGFEPSFVLAYQGPSLVGGAQLLCRRWPGLGGIGYLPYGPLVFDPDARPQVGAALCSALEDLRTLGLRALFVQPADGDDDISALLLDRGFRTSSAGIAPRSSVHVDLTRPEDELHAALSKKIRRWTKRWDQRGVRVRSGDETDLPLLADLLAQTASHQGFTPLSHDYLRRLYGELAPSGRALLFVGEIEGSPVAASLMTGCGGVLKTRVSGFDRSRDTTELRVPAAVRWTAIRWAKVNGYRWFDFSGLSESSTDKLLSGAPVDTAQLPGPDQFKLSFGSTAYRYPQPVELFRSPALRRTYDLSIRHPRGQRLQGAVKTALRGGHRAH